MCWMIQNDFAVCTLHGTFVCVLNKDKFALRITCPLSLTAEAPCHLATSVEI